MQAAHAGIQAAHAFPTDDPSPNLVVLAVGDASALARAVTRARDADVPITTFFETDDDMGFTAAATAPLTRAQGRIFRDYRLWQHPDVAQRQSSRALNAESESSTLSIGSCGEPGFVRG